MTNAAAELLPARDRWPGHARAPGTGNFTSSVCSALLAASGFGTVAADPAETRKTVPAVRATAPPSLDGRLDDDVWRYAAVIDDLHVVVPDEYATPADRSRVYVAYDDDALYLAARFWDREPDEVTARVLRQGDVSYGEDGFSVILDPYDQGRSGYIFDINPNGVRSDGLFVNVTTENWDWSGIWHGAARRDGEGWSAEVAIPFKTLSFDPARDRWGINFTRWLGRRNERFGWVSHNREQFPSHTGALEGLSGLKQGLGLDVVPGVRIGDAHDFETQESDSYFEPSLDAFYKITPSLTAALTLNPDFAGTTVDARQINLTRFDLFFPEQRAFFLQDADIFEFGRIADENGRPFFSRRIGLGNDGESVALDAGLKLTGRIGGWDLGVLGVRQDAASGSGSTDLFVGRLATNVLAESSLGLIVTSGNPDGELQNSLAGFDFRYLNTRLGADRTLEASLWFQHTQTEGLHGDESAYGIKLEMPNSRGWRGELGYATFEENYYPALGFANRTGIDHATAALGYLWRPDSSWVRSVLSVIEAERIDAIDSDERTDEIVWKVFEIENQMADYLNVEVIRLEETLLEPFEISEGIEIPAGRYTYDHYCSEVWTGEHRVVALESWACAGEFYDGDFWNAGGKLTWRPSPHLRVTTGVDVHDIDLPQGSFVTRLYSLQADIAFTATWYWENFLQYDNVSDTLGINSIVRWIPEAGRETVLVLNRQFEDYDEDRRFESLERDLTFKLSYTFRF